MNRIKRKAMCLLAACSMFTIGSCAVDSWKLAGGPVFSGDNSYGGIELEFSNGFDFIIPFVGLGGNF